ncbi:HER235Wp [Eremothecium sinecaudum]|uniref:HER235Wp n=1 Tax=Eremothecium sinecaudum TaxID=45286 RepID=A0A109V089_9SACH|nr:HER235Wp [Eremothecium sinecaudum]AMD21513.1 HER235Wp [Eremothecium sinecaudum]
MRILNLALIAFSIPFGLGLADNDTINEVTNDTVHNEVNFCKMDKGQMIGSTCDLTFHNINDINAQIRDDLKKLVHTDFFRYFKLDLYTHCPFWDNNNGFCMNRACAVDIVEDWSSLPEMWQPDALGGLEGEQVQPKMEEDESCAFLNSLCGDKNPKEPIDIEYCDVKDYAKEGSVLVDLTANPERFTGYGGEQSAQIWSAIYKENCFTLGERGLCLAKDVFYRLISGLHASIATHLSNDFLNTTTGEWGPNLDLFMDRVGNFPERVANIYFNFAVVAKALWKISPYLHEVSICTSYNEDVRSRIDNVVSKLDSSIFNEDLLFQDDISSVMKHDFRTRFKNVTRIMDCVHCDRCRMWGKVQTTGYATGLKILFELDNEDEESRKHILDKITKYELIALLNTFDRVSKSVESIANFERMYNERARASSGKLASFFQLNNFFKILSKARKDINDTFASAEESEEDIETVTSTVTKFDDLIMPEKKQKSPSNKPEGRWESAWNTEIDNVKQALNFIWRSYVGLPGNSMRLLIGYFGKWFNRFIGVNDYVKGTDDPADYAVSI